MKKRYYIKGMHCKSCEIVLEKSISQIGGVKRVNVSERKGFADVEFAGGSAHDALIAKAVSDAGYSLGIADKRTWFSRDSEAWFEIVIGISVLFLFWIVAMLTGVFNSFNAKFAATPTYPIVFVIGLTAGISTCMAMVGGLVAGFSASYAESHQYATRWQRFKPNVFFNAGRLASYALLGGAIGALGSVVKFSTGFTGFLVAAAGVVMVYMGLKLTGASPKISHMSVTVPKKLGQMFGVKDATGGYSHGEAFVGGALTFFLPCGFTQAMQLYAMTTGSFVSGALIMFLFALGTMPGLLGIGAVTSILEGRPARMFFRFVGLIVLILGIFNIANGYTLSGFTIPLPSISFGDGSAAAAPLAPMEGGEQIVNMTQLANGYQPNRFTVKKGIPVEWIIDSQDAYTCAASIRMPAFNIAQFLKQGTNVIRFTPTEAGTVRFTCGMGMYSGTFNVVE